MLSPMAILYVIFHSPNFTRLPSPHLLHPSKTDSHPNPFYQQEESYLSGAWRSGFDPKVIHIQNDIVNNGYGALEFDLASASSSNAKIVCGPFFPTRGATYRFSANVRKSAGTSFTINISDPDGTIKTFDMDADTGADEWEHIEHVFTFEKTALVVTFAGQGDSSVYLDDVELVKCEAKTGSTFQKRSSVDSCG